MFDRFFRHVKRHRQCGGVSSLVTENKIQIDDVHGDIASAEREFSIVIASVSFFVTQLTVFDDPQMLTGLAEDAHFLIGIGFGDRFGTELRTVDAMQTH